MGPDPLCKPMLVIRRYQRLSAVLSARCRVLFEFEPATETIDLTGGVHQPLRAREERVTLRADLDLDFLPR